MLHIVLMSGGSGTRLWPLSSGVRTKVFLKLLTAPDGREESMIQRVCRQLGTAGLLASTHIVTHSSLAELTCAELGENARLIVEPHRRGTLYAVLLATAYLKERAGAAPDDCVCVLPADLFVEQPFYSIVSAWPELLARTQAELGLIGAAPDHPSDQYGYIVPCAASDTGYARIRQFAEKPDPARAVRLIAQHALWNCGVFAYRLDVMLAKFAALSLPTDCASLLAAYPSLPEASFDTEIAEACANAIVVPYDGPWRDLGTWSTLTERIGRQVIGPGSLDERSAGTHLVNELNIPIHVIGCPNLIVAAGAEGILIADKAASHAVRHIAKGGPSSGAPTRAAAAQE